MIPIAQGIILFVAGICAIIGCFFIIHVAARMSRKNINGEHALTGLFIGWLFLTTAWVFARYGGVL